MNAEHRKKEIIRILLIILFFNLLVAIVKILYGLSVNSLAIYSDGFHSLFDGVNNVGGIIGIYLASRPADQEHPYGHRKYETVFAVFIGILMGFASLEILKGAYESLIKERKAEIDEKAFYILVGTLIINIFVAFYEKRKGKSLKSEFLIADSAHTKVDVYITSGIILSTILVRKGLYILDPLAGLLIGILVAREAFQIIKESTQVLIDRALLNSSDIERLVKSFKDVEQCKDIRTRGTTGQIFVDLKILVNPSISVSEGHEVAEKVEKLIKERFPDVIDVVVHVEPYEK